MREIKFRGKRVDNGEWVYGGLATCGEHAFIVISEIQISESDNIYFSTTGIEVDPATVGQYTGLKDKKEMESYHKDIVRTNAGLVGVVEFGSYSTTGNEWDNAWGWFIQIPNGDQASMDEHFGYWGEVIGNAHENPELLEGGKFDAD